MKLIILTLNIPKRDYLVDDFINKIKVDRNIKDFKILCYFTRYDSWTKGVPNLIDLFSFYNISLETYGEITKLVASYTNEYKQIINVEYFAYLNPETRILYCITDAISEDIRRTLERMATKSIGFYYVPVLSSTFNIISDMLNNRYEKVRCTYFTAHHSPQYRIKGDIRSDVNRTIQYYGVDGFQCMEELKQFYGMMPRTIRYNVSGLSSYEISVKGRFWKRGKGISVSSKSLLFDIVDVAVNDLLRRRNIIDESKLTYVSIQTENKSFNLPQLVPLIVEFTDTLDDSYLDAFVEHIERNNFTFYNYTQNYEGSFVFSGMVYDDNKNDIFSIHVDNEKIIIAPTEENQFDTFFHFYEVIEQFDPGIIIKEFK